MPRYRVFFPEYDFRTTVDAVDPEEAAALAAQMCDGDNLEIANRGYADAEVIREDTDEVDKVTVHAEINVDYRSEKG